MPHNTDDSLELKDVTLSLDGVHLFAPLNIIVRAGEVATIMGPSGCGKSSLLSHICGTLAPAFTARGDVTLGETRLDGLPPDQRNIGILFQDDLLFPHLSVGENLAFGLPPDIRGREARRTRIEIALDDAGLPGMADRDPTTLSGGQRTRVALMRSLLSRPRALLLDEPFSKLDAGLRDRIRDFVFEHSRANGIPALLVTHDPADAAAANGTKIELQ